MVQTSWRSPLGAQVPLYHPCKSRLPSPEGGAEEKVERLQGGEQCVHVPPAVPEAWVGVPHSSPCLLHPRILLSVRTSSTHPRSIWHVATRRVGTLARPDFGVRAGIRRACPLSLLARVRRCVSRRSEHKSPLYKPFKFRLPREEGREAPGGG